MGPEPGGARPSPPTDSCVAFLSSTDSLDAGVWLASGAVRFAGGAVVGVVGSGAAGAGVTRSVALALAPVKPSGAKQSVGGATDATTSTVPPDAPSARTVTSRSPSRT